MRSLSQNLLTGVPGRGNVEDRGVFNVARILAHRPELGVSLTKDAQRTGVRATVLLDGGAGKPKSDGLPRPAHLYRSHGQLNRFHVGEGLGRRKTWEVPLIPSLFATKLRVRVIEHYAVKELSMTKFNWEKAQQIERLREQGTVRAEPEIKRKRRRKKKLHPNSTAAKKWGRKKWRFR